MDRFVLSPTRLFVGLFAILVAIPLTVAAQGTATRPNNYYLLTPDKSLLPLPSATIELKGKGKLLGFGGSKVSADIAGESASVRVRAGDPQVFVLGVQGPMKEPLPSILWAQLHKLAVIKGGKREWISSDVTTYGLPIAKAKSDTGPGIPLNFKLFDPQSIKAEPRTTLSPGEYAFVTKDDDPYQSMQQFRLFCFGVD